MTYTPYLNLKGSINAAIADRQRADLGLQARAVGIAASVLGIEPHFDAIQAEMSERVHEALEFIDWVDAIEDDGDYEEWVAETQDLRHGG